MTKVFDISWKGICNNLGIPEDSSLEYITHGVEGLVSFHYRLPASKLAAFIYQEIDTEDSKELIIQSIDYALEQWFREKHAILCDQPTAMRQVGSSS